MPNIDTHLFWFGRDYNALCPEKWQLEHWFDNVENSILDEAGSATDNYPIMAYNGGSRSCAEEEFVRAAMALSWLVWLGSSGSDLTERTEEANQLIKYGRLLISRDLCEWYVT